MNYPFYRRTGTKSINAYPDSLNYRKYKLNPDTWLTYHAITSFLEQGKVSYRILTIVRYSTNNKEE